MGTSTENFLSSRDRILLSAKGLFAKNGYEGTSTVAIARQAGTSESQLMKHFGSKQGLLFAILEQGWSAILHRAYALSSVADRSPQTVVDILDSVFVELEHDPEMKSILVLESRRARRDNPAGTPGEGYLQFSTLLENILKDLKQRGILRAEVSVTATAAALFGVIDGMLFEQVVSARSGRKLRFEAEESRGVIDAVISGLVTEPVTSAANQTEHPSWTHGH